MHISTKGRYGLRAILDLAIHYQDRPVTLSAIAARQQLSEGYLEQLMAPLKKAGLVGSSRGAQGGYYLTRAPQDISVDEVFRALEGPLKLTPCIAEDQAGDCFRKGNCGSAFIWQEIQEAISGILEKYTLADLMTKENR
ncbi:MAG: Rrf2 family transcriptional regulator [Firmicutes bacterium]|nr:Rrf2 family transcriptional regulator [Bacillota bacterium]